MVTFRILLSWLRSISFILPSWYVLFKAPSFLRKSITSPSFTSQSLSNHFGLCISLGTCVINQFSNQALNICSLHFKNVFGLLLTFNGPIGLRSLFRPSHNRFGVIRRFSRSPVMFPMAQSRLLMGFEISAVRVSHGSIDSRLFMIVFELILWCVEFFALLSCACDEPPLDIAHNRHSSAGEVEILRLGSLFS